MVVGPSRWTALLGAGLLILARALPVAVLGGAVIGGAVVGWPTEPTGMVIDYADLKLPLRTLVVGLAD